MKDRLADWFSRIFMHNRWAPYAIVLAGVEGMVSSYFSFFEPERFWFELLISGVITVCIAFPAIYYFMGQHRQLVAMAAELERISTTDQMTGLLNRHTFMRRVGDMLEQHPRGESAGAFAYIDADHFKSINDRYGHAAGDEVICLIADCIRAATRANDYVARLGGEEFGAFLVGATSEQAGDVAERIREHIARRKPKLPGTNVNISVSAGVAAHRPGESVEQTMLQADESLYAAKKGGRDAVVIELRKYMAA